MAAVLGTNIHDNRPQSCLSLLTLFPWPFAQHNSLSYSPALHDLTIDHERANRAPTCNPPPIHNQRAVQPSPAQHSPAQHRKAQHCMCKPHCAVWQLLLPEGLACFIMHRAWRHNRHGHAAQDACMLMYPPDAPDEGVDDKHERPPVVPEEAQAEVVAAVLHKESQKSHTSSSVQVLCARHD